MILLLSLACSSLPFGDKDSCTADTGVALALDLPASPDFTADVPDDAGELGFAGDWWIEGQPYQVLAWDCTAVSWWSPTEPQKVVQVVSLGTGCGDGATVDVSTYACDSHEGADAPFRDWDGDGVTTHDGDCDDEDATVGAC